MDGGVYIITVVHKTKVLDDMANLFTANFKKLVFPVAIGAGIKREK